MTPFLLPAEPISSLEEYLATETGGAGIARARQIGRDATISEVSLSGLRGRGGGGFPTGTKWSGIASSGGGQRFVVCNGAEGEPGTFKDRALIRANPYQLVEGLIIAGFAVGADGMYLCLKARFEQEVAGVIGAIQEFQSAGICSDCTVTIVTGPDEYLFGEEKAMLEVIEGNEPLPRWLPPHLHGLFETAPQLGWQAHESSAGSAPGPNPTLVNNVETLCNVTHILAKGTDWFRTMGTADAPGGIVARAPPGSSSTTTQPAWWRSRTCPRDSCRSSPAGSVSVQARIQRDHPTPGTNRDRRRRHQRHRRDHRLARPRRRRQPLLPRSGGTGHGPQHPGRVPRRVRRTHRTPRMPATTPIPDPKIGRPARGARNLRRIILAKAPRLDLRRRTN